MLIAITGANGFIGKNLSNHLISKGLEVRKIQRSPGKDIINIDEINEHTDWKLALKGVDIVIHCASKLDNSSSNKTLSDNSYMEINFKGTKNLVSEAMNAGVKRFIFLSTVKVLGEFTKKGLPFKSNSKVNPQSQYALSKLHAENEVKSICKENRMEYVIVRSTLVYGPGVRANFLNLIKIVKSRLPIPLLSIKNSRSILYLGNLLDFIEECIENPLAKNKTFLLSDQKPVSTPDLIKLIGKAFNVRTLLIYIPNIILKILATLTRTTKKMEKLQESLEIDAGEAYKELNFQPSYTTLEGLNITAKSYNKKYLS